MMTRRALVVVLALAPPPAVIEGWSDDKLVPALAARLRRIESAFRDGDAGSLRGSFSTRGKVRVELQGLTDGPGPYGPGQLQVIFSRIFAEFQTREFSFGRDDVDVSNPRTTFAKGRWVRRGPASGRETVDTLTFTLHPEGGDWRILEIRSGR